MSERLSEAQRRALESSRDYGNPTKHLSGMSDWGGWGSTRQALFRKGLLDPATFQITDAGRAALAKAQEG